MFHKTYADNRRGAAKNPVMPGDRVLLKTTKTFGKLNVSEPWKVQTKEGSEVTVRSKEGVEYRRNSSFVERYSQPENVQESATTGNEEPVNPAPVSSNSEEIVATSGPRRTVGMPEKYKDYKLYQLNSDQSLDLR